MNAKRRKALQSVINAMEESRDALACIQEEEQDAYDNMPESLQYSERGETMEENISTIEDAQSDLDDIISTLYELLG